MGVGRGLVQEKILDDDQFHRLQTFGHMLGVGIGLGKIFALDENALECAFHRGIEHVGNAQSGFRIQVTLPQINEKIANGVVRDMPVAGKFMGEGAHVTSPLDVVLAPERIEADADPSDIPCRHGQVRHPHDHGGALAMLGDTKAEIDGTVSCGGVEARGGAHLDGGHPGDLFERFGRVPLFANEFLPLLEIRLLATFLHVILVDQSFGHHDMGQRVDHGDIGPRPELQMMRGLHMGHTNEIDPPRINDDEFGALAQTALHSGGKHRMGIGGIGADDYEDVGFVDALEILGPGRGSQGRLETITCRRMADPGAGVDVVVVERRTDHLLDYEHLFIGAA